MDYDQVLQEIGQFGLWQIWICFLASLSAMAAALITMQVWIFSRIFFLWKISWNQRIQSIFFFSILSLDTLITNTLGVLSVAVITLQTIILKIISRILQFQILLQLRTKLVSSMKWSIQKELVPRIISTWTNSLLVTNIFILQMFSMNFHWLKIMTYLLALMKIGL